MKNKKIFFQKFNIKFMATLYNYILKNINKIKFSKIKKIINQNREYLLYLDQNNYNPLMAYLEGNTNPKLYIIILLASYQTIRNKNNRQEIPLHIYLESSGELNPEIISILSDPEILTTQNLDLENPLMVYLLIWNIIDLNIIQLLQNHISLNQTNSDGLTPLNIYLVYNQDIKLEIINQLLNRSNFNLTAKFSPLCDYIFLKNNLDLDIIKKLKNNLILDHIQPITWNNNNIEFIFPLILYLIKTINSEPDINILKLLISKKNLLFFNYQNLLPINYYLLNSKKLNPEIIKLLSPQ